jgi:GT2 family glycosyltransferase
MQVAVVIVSFNTRELVRACLESVRESGADEVVVVDNASVDGTVDMVREGFPDVTVLANAINRGYGAAANQGGASCTAPCVVILNGDTRVGSGTCARLGDYLDRHPGVALVGPRLVNPDGTDQLSCFPFPGSFRWLLENKPLSSVCRWIPALRRRLLCFTPPTERQAVPWVLGAAFAVRRDAYEDVGGFDEAYYMYFEEVDLCWRLRERGWDVHLDPTATVVHVGGASTEQRWYEMSMQHYASTLRFYEGHYDGAQLAVWRALTKTKMGVRLLRDSIGSRRARDPEQRALHRDRAVLWWTALRSHPTSERPEPREAARGRGAAEPHSGRDGNPSGACPLASEEVGGAIASGRGRR